MRKLTYPECGAAKCQQIHAWQGRTGMVLK